MEINGRIEDGEALTREGDKVMLRFMTCWWESCVLLVPVSPVSSFMVTAILAASLHALVEAFATPTFSAFISLAARLIPVHSSITSQPVFAPQLVTIIETSREKGQRRRILRNYRRAGMRFFHKEKSGKVFFL